MDAVEQGRGSHDLLTVREVAAELRCSKSTIYRACRERGLEWFRLRPNGEIRIPYFALQALISPHLHQAAEEATAAVSNEVS